MPVISIALALLLIGFMLYLLTSAPIPIHPWFKTLIVGLVCFAVLIWLLNQLGVGPGLSLRLR